jgi:capsular polysaccharide biosynthesis protein
MSEQPLTLKRSLQIVRDRLIAVAILTALGLLAGAGYTELNLPMHASSALVVLPASTTNTGTQMLIATSVPVLESALSSVHPAVSLKTIRNSVQVTSVGVDVLSITAQGGTAAQSENMANAVADSYVAYVGAANTPAGRLQAQVLAPAASATATELPVRMSATAILGALAGALVGVIGALAIGRHDRRLRERDEIADAIGVPVLASFPVTRPANAAGWAKLLEDYQPSVTAASRLRNVLSYLGLAGMTPAGGGAGASSLTVLSLSSDPGALALGPQLATFAAADGIPTMLVIGPDQDSSTAAALRAAAVAPPSSRRSGRLRLAVADNDDLGLQPTAALSVVATVVDDRAPRVVGPMRTGATLLGVSAGAATAEQLARVAASAAANGYRITGILVANPDPADPTTGRVPQLARPAQGRMPEHLTGTLR